MFLLFQSTLTAGGNSLHAIDCAQASDQPSEHDVSAQQLQEDLAVAEAAKAAAQLAAMRAAAKQATDRIEADLKAKQDAADKKKRAAEQAADCAGTAAKKRKLGEGPAEAQVSL